MCSILMNLKATRSKHTKNVNFSRGGLFAKTVPNVRVGNLGFSNNFYYFQETLVLNLTNAHLGPDKSISK